MNTVPELSITQQSIEDTWIARVEGSNCFKVFYFSMIAALLVSLGLILILSYLNGWTHIARHLCC